MATKKKTLIGKDTEELLMLVSKKREEIRVLRFSAAGSKNHNVKQNRELRREIARALTKVNAQKQAGSK